MLKEMQHLVLDRGRFVFQEKSDHFHILAPSVHKIGDARKNLMKITVERGAAEKMLIENMLWEFNTVLLKKSSLFITRVDTKMQILALSAHQVSGPICQTPYWTVKCHFASRKTSTETSIKENSPVVLEKFGFQFREKLFYAIFGDIYPKKPYGSIGIENIVVEWQIEK